MKVFVYTKRNSKPIRILTDVKIVAEREDNRIAIVSKDGTEYVFDTKEVKTTICQN